jgi:predicted nuclease of predicted toxin-antitoxin system
VKVKLDENITTAAKSLIAQHGHEVDTVVDEGLTGATDSVVIEACRSDERMLVTFDVGFGASAHIGRGPTTASCCSASWTNAPMPRSMCFAAS